MELETKKNRRLMPSLSVLPFSFCGLATTSAVADAGCSLGSNDAGTAATGDTTTYCGRCRSGCGSGKTTKPLKQANAKEQGSSSSLDLGSKVI